MLFLHGRIFSPVHYPQPIGPYYHNYLGQGRVHYYGALIEGIGQWKRHFPYAGKD